jgi:hypothetical protein
MVDIGELQKKLKIIADVVNSFKSEPVQLRVVDALIGQLGAPIALTSGQSDDISETPTRSRRPSAKSNIARPKVKAGGSRSSPGAYTMITELLGSGFFKQPKTISDIVDHCAANRGHHYKANECSPALLRQLRDKKLKRQKNENRQYEYTQT